VFFYVSFQHTSRLSCEFLTISKFNFEIVGISEQIYVFSNTKVNKISEITKNLVKSQSHIKVSLPLLPNSIFLQEIIKKERKCTF